MVRNNGTFAARNKAVKLIEFMYRHQDCFFTPASAAQSVNMNINTTRRLLRELQNADCVLSPKKGIYKVTFDEFTRFRSLIIDTNSWKKKEVLQIAHT